MSLALLSTPLLRALFTLTNNAITLTGNVTNNSANTETINFPIASTGTADFFYDDRWW